MSAVPDDAAATSRILPEADSVVYCCPSNSQATSFFCCQFFVELSHVGVARGVLNSLHYQFATTADGFARKKLNMLSRVELCREVCTAPVGSSDPGPSFKFCGQLDWINILNMFSFQFIDQIRRELVAKSIHTADATRLDIGVGSVYCVLCIV